MRQLLTRLESFIYLEVDAALVVDAEPDERLIFAAGGVVIVVVGGVRAQVGVLLPVERLQMSEKIMKGQRSHEGRLGKRGLLWLLGNKSFLVIGGRLRFSQIG